MLYNVSKQIFVYFAFRGGMCGAVVRAPLPPPPPRGGGGALNRCNNYHLHLAKTSIFTKRSFI